jgi:hypothetical protein
VASHGWQFSREIGYIRVGKNTSSVGLLSECFLHHSWGMLNWPQGQVEPSIPRYFLDRGKLVIRSHNDCARHCLDHFWGAQKNSKIDLNSSRFCWNVMRCFFNCLESIPRVWRQNFRIHLIVPNFGKASVRYFLVLHFWSKFFKESCLYIVILTYDLWYYCRLTSTPKVVNCTLMHNVCLNICMSREQTWTLLENA